MSSELFAKSLKIRTEVLGEAYDHLAIYVGVPAAVDSFRLARETFAEIVGQASTA